MRLNLLSKQNKKVIPKKLERAQNYPVKFFSKNIALL